jgi:hypothetical protein
VAGRPRPRRPELVSKARPIRVCALLATRYSLATDRVSDLLQARRSEGSRPRHRDADNAAGGERHVATGARLALLQEG